MPSSGSFWEFMIEAKMNQRRIKEEPKKNQRRSKEESKKNQRRIKEDTKKKKGKQQSLRCI